MFERAANLCAEDFGARWTNCLILQQANTVGELDIAARCIDLLHNVALMLVAPCLRKQVIVTIKYD